MLVGIKRNIVLAFSLNEQSTFKVFAEKLLSINMRTSPKETIKINKKKSSETSETNCHLFAFRPVLQLEFMHRIWFEAQFAALAFEFATAFRGNSKHRLQSVHHQASLLRSRPSNCHVTRRSKFMNLQKQAGRQTHDRSCCRCTFHRPSLSAFLPVLAVCFVLSLFGSSDGSLRQTQG